MQLVATTLFPSIKLTLYSPSHVEAVWMRCLDLRLRVRRVETGEGIQTGKAVWLETDPPVISPPRQSQVGDCGELRILLAVSPTLDWYHRAELFH